MVVRESVARLKRAVRFLLPEMEEGDGFVAAASRAYLGCSVLGGLPHLATPKQQQRSSFWGMRLIAYYRKLNATTQASEALPVLGSHSKGAGWLAEWEGKSSLLGKGVNR